MPSGPLCSTYANYRSSLCESRDGCAGMRKQDTRKDPCSGLVEDEKDLCSGQLDPIRR